jgi:hypothetical protein
MKKIGFLSFGHWTPSPQSEAQTAADVLLQSIDLAVEAERLGVDGAYFRVHHFARQLSSPFPLLAAVGARTKKIEIGTGVIDMRYEKTPFTTPIVKLGRNREFQSRCRLRGTYQELVGACGCTAFDYRLQVWAQIFDVRGVITGCSLFWERSH